MTSISDENVKYLVCIIFNFILFFNDYFWGDAESNCLLILVKSCTT